MNPKTSVMIKNIPNKYNRELMMQDINKNHQGTYNFFYLPIDFRVITAVDEIKTNEFCRINAMLDMLLSILLIANSSKNSTWNSIIKNGRDLKARR